MSQSSPCCCCCLPDLARILHQHNQEPTTTTISSNTSSNTSNKQPITSLLDLDMTGIHSAVHVAKSLGQLEIFREHYLDQRRLQISADLQPPLNFLESYQSYLAQVGGPRIGSKSGLQFRRISLIQYDSWVKVHNSYNHETYTSAGGMSLWSRLMNIDCYVTSLDYGPLFKISELLGGSSLTFGNI